jgi:three-Cys-motif partner protein
MAHKPKDVRWARRRHTEAKHEVLCSYLDAWIPILIQAGRSHLVLVDGFAGPGRYAGGEKGSPLLMLDAYLRRGDRDRLATATLHYFFIEADRKRLESLQEEVGRVTVTPNVRTECIHGTFEKEFPRVVKRVLSELGQPPIFAFIDPFGAPGVLELTGQLVGLPRCEALVYMPLTNLVNFATKPEMQSTLANLFGDDSWMPVLAIDDAGERRRFLHDLFRARLKRSCEWVRSFEIVPSGGGRSYFLFFGTNNELGLRRMKEAMWKLDPAGGQRFKDSTLVDHPVLFGPEPDYRELLRLLREHFGTAEFSIEEAAKFTLFETPFRDDAHLKRPTLAPEEKADGLKVTRAKPGRRLGTFPAETRMCFVA